jgi:broad specificity phosphatase PhoE
MPELVLVRHAMPEVKPDVPAERWSLGADGRAAARELAAALPRAPFVVTSNEPKARQTAQEIVGVCGGALTVDARLVETRRPHAWSADFPELARQFVAGRAHHGWEPQRSVAERFDAAVREALDAPGFWSQLAFPDAWAVDVERSHGALAAANKPTRV